jgi:amino acid transporter
MRNVKPPKVLSVFAIAMMSVAGIVNLRNIPIMATAGFSAVFFYLLAALVFLIPSALVCSELASTWPEAGGVFLWVKKAFGEKVGFFSIWSEWFNNVIGFPATLSFIAATLAFIFFPELNNHKFMLFGLMLVILWSVTFFNFFGIKASSRLNIVGALAGSIVPGLIIIALGAWWLIEGRPIQIDFSWQSLFPKSQVNSLVFFLGVLSGYAGMQITAFHAHNVKNPARDFPRAIRFAVLMIVGITVFSSLAIAIVVPKNQISLVAGVMQGFAGFLSDFHLAWALPILILLIVISGVSSLSAWLLGPARGLAVASQSGLFPRWCSKENKHGMPTNILILQAVVSTMLASLFLFADSLSVALWMLVVLTSQFTLVMDILIFASGIKLRYSQKDVVRPFKVPGGKLGIWAIAGTSIVICSIGIILGFFPPADLPIHNIGMFEAFLISGNLIYIGMPFVIYFYSKRQVAITETELQDVEAA